MYNDLKTANAEGVVFKLKSSKHVAGRPSSGGPHLKNKFQKEASFIVKDITKGKRSVGLELINENIGNHKFGVLQLAEKMNCSRPQLYRKVNAIKQNVIAQ